MGSVHQHGEGDLQKGGRLTDGEQHGEGDVGGAHRGGQAHHGSGAAIADNTVDIAADIAQEDAV